MIWFFCVGAKPLLFVVVNIGERQQQRHHSSNAPISNPFVIALALPTTTLMRILFCICLDMMIPF